MTNALQIYSITNRCIKNSTLSHVESGRLEEQGCQVWLLS
jgi:hypothetical protein